MQETLVSHSDNSKLLQYRDSIYAIDLLVCAIIHLDLFTFLKESSRSFFEICSHLCIASRPTDVMLTLFQAMELITFEENTYSLTPLAEEYLVSDTPWSLAPYYATLKDRVPSSDFLKVLKHDKPAGWVGKKRNKEWVEAMRNEQFADFFTSAMDSRGFFLAQELVKKLNVSQYKSLLDIGGGSGIYACKIAERYRNLDVTILEIPPIDEATQRSLEKKYMAKQIIVIPGDMFAEIPQNYDIHLFANTIHDWNYQSIEKLIKRSYSALNPHGLIVIFDAHLNNQKDGPLSVAEYSCLVMYSSEGRCYSQKEISNLLQQSGFHDTQVIDIAADRSAIIGYKGN